MATWTTFGTKLAILSEVELELGREIGMTDSWGTRATPRALLASYYGVWIYRPDAADRDFPGPEGREKIARVELYNWFPPGSKYGRNGYLVQIRRWHSDAREWVNSGEIIRFEGDREAAHAFADRINAG